MNDPRVDLGSQLTGAAAEQCLDALDSVRPIVRLGKELSEPTATAAAALVHLIGRLHPHVVVDGDATLGSNPWRSSTVADTYDVVPRPIATREPGHDIVIGIGDVPDADLWVGGDDWTAAVADEPLDALGRHTALGLHAAAAIAAAEVLKRQLAPLGLVQASPVPSMIWNLIDYRTGAAGLAEEANATAPPLAVIGAGSIGSSVAGLLAATGPGGEVALVDADEFDPQRNPYRYPAATKATSGLKTAWLASILSESGWRATSHDCPVADWTRSRPEPGFDGVVVSSVDRVDARADVADVLARTTLSVGVSGLAFHVECEHPADDLACPYCQYLAVGTPMSQLAVYEAQTGIPMVRIAELLDGGRLEDRDIEVSVAAGRIHSDRAHELVGRRFEDLVRRAYAQATVRTVGGDTIAVSAPSVSWLAAVIVVAEIRKLEKVLPALDRRVDVDLSGIPTGMTRRVGRDRSGRCLCANPFRTRVARRLYDPCDSRERG